MFEERQVDVVQVKDAKKEKIDAEKAWDMIRTCETVWIGKGKKVLEFSPGGENREDILKAAMGRSGNLRAPSVKAGKQMLIGYNEALYQNL